MREQCSFLDNNYFFKKLDKSDVLHGVSLFVVTFEENCSLRSAKSQNFC